MQFSDRFSIDFLMIFERFWEAFGFQIDAKINEKMYQFLDRFFEGFLMKKGGKMEAWGSPNGEKNWGISWTFRKPLPGALQGRVWGGFWVDLGRILGGFWRDLGGFWEDFHWNLGWFSIEFSKEGLGRVLDGFGEDLGRALDGFGMFLKGFWLKFGKVFD